MFLFRSLGCLTSNSVNFDVSKRSSKRALSHQGKVEEEDEEDDGEVVTIYDSTYDDEEIAYMESGLHLQVTILSFFI